MAPGVTIVRVCRDDELKCVALGATKGPSEGRARQECGMGLRVPFASFQETGHVEFYMDSPNV